MMTVEGTKRSTFLNDGSMDDTSCNSEGQEFLLSVLRERLDRSSKDSNGDTVLKIHDEVKISSGKDMTRTTPSTTNKKDEKDGGWKTAVGCRGSGGATTKALVVDDKATTASNKTTRVACSSMPGHDVISAEAAILAKIGGREDTLSSTDDTLEDSSPEAPTLRYSTAVVGPAVPGAFANTPGSVPRRRPNREEEDETLDLSEAPTDVEEGLVEIPTFAPAVPTHAESPAEEEDEFDCLSVAMPVDDESLSIAEAHEYQDRPSKARTSRNAALIAASIVVVALVVIVVTCVVVLVQKKEGQSESTDEASITVPTLSPTMDWLLELPESTMAAILEDPGSAQAKAYGWLQGDPSFVDYTESRRLQQFVLATLYYATNGDNWELQNNWLSYDIHECHDWFNQARIVTGFDPCTPEDEYWTLALSSNGLMGTIPLEMGLLTSLGLLILGGNTLVGSIPQQIWDLPSLGLLTLNSNSLTGSLPPESLEAIQHRMIWLDLHGNWLQGTLPTELGLLTACTHLGLNDNQFQGTIPSEVGQMVSMERIALSFNMLEGSIPPELFLDWNKLTHLEFRENPLTGTIPTEIGLLSALKECYLYSCQLNGQIPSEVGSLLNLTHMVWHSNNLSSSLPEKLYQLTKLEDFNLWQNSISGTLATEVGLLTNLMRFNVEENQMSGKVPSSLSQLTKLTHLGLSENSFKGSIPSAVWDFPLEYLWVGGNITGSIPDNMGLNLVYLNLTSSRISGTIPDYLCGNPGLEFDCSDSLCGCSCECN